MLNNILKYFVYLVISIIYNLLFHQIGNINDENLSIQQIKDKKFIVLVVGSVVGIVLSKILYEKNTRINNDTLSNGLYMGSILMISYAIGDHWYDMNNEIKVFILFVGLIWFTILIYKKFPNKKEKKKRKKKKIYKLKKIN